MARAAHALARIGIVGILAVAWTGDASAADWTAAKVSRADELVAHFLRPQRLDGVAPPPALSLAIGVDGELVLAKGYGEGREGTPADAQTVYQIGSLTKQFTAAVVLRLIEEGASAPLTGTPLTLDTPMRDIFMGVESWTTSDEPPITVRSLLNMTSNLPNFTRKPPASVDPWGAVAAPRLLHELKKLSPSGWPNSFEYSNTSYFLLAEIAERSTDSRRAGGESFRDLVRSELLLRAGMKATGFAGENAPGLELAKPHYRRRPAFAQPDWLKGSADMTSNVLDLFAWNRALMAGAILGPGSMRAMFAEGGRVGPTTYYGMGWFIEHEQGWDAFRHSGSVPGFTSLNAIFRRQGTPHWISITLLTNADGVEGLDTLADDLFGVVSTAE
jgi:CubicO group peptidase (beta-lactamase class C family)